MGRRGWRREGRALGRLPSSGKIWQAEEGRQSERLRAVPAPRSEILKTHNRGSENQGFISPSACLRYDLRHLGVAGGCGSSCCKSRGGKNNWEGFGRLRATGTCLAGAQAEREKEAQHQVPPMNSMPAGWVGSGGEEMEKPGLSDRSGLLAILSAPE